MAMTAMLLSGRVSNREHVNCKGILPETPIFQLYFICLTYIMLDHCIINSLDMRFLCKKFPSPLGRCYGSGFG